jgi:hypothetical protein
MMLPFNRNEGLILVPTRLVGPKGDSIALMALDTGATRSMVGERFLVPIGYDPEMATETERFATGSMEESEPLITIERIEAFRQERMNFRVICHTLPPSADVDGVLGLDFFRGHRIVLDFRAGIVTID